MDVNSLKPTDRVNANAGVSNTAAPNFSPTANQVQLAETRSDVQKAESKTEERKELDKDELLPITRELNKFMAQLNADIEFELHERTQQLMVRVVDTKDKKILKEFPPKELLDTVANIREYVGILLDKRA